jgi:hypothetical protein
MFLASGEATESVDVMEHLWTGHWPETRSPQIIKFSLDGRNAFQNVHLAAGQLYRASVEANSPSGDPLHYAWEVMEESDAKSVGGDMESRPMTIPGVVQENTASTQLRAPAKPGAYRLYVYVLDKHQKAGYANIPFYVEEKTTTVAGQ